MGNVLHSAVLNQGGGELKKRYAVDLSAQMAESEANYARLMRLMPAFDEVDAVR